MGRPGRVLVLASLLTLTSCANGGGRITAPAPREAGPAGAAVATPHPLGVRVETFVDPSRPTAEHGSAPGSSSRTLRTTIVFPAVDQDGPPDTARGPYPLIVFAHGSGGFGSAYLPMLRGWAAAGYVVAAPAFPLAAPGGGALGDESSLEDLPNLPADMTFVMTQLLQLNDDPASPLRGLVDPARVGAAGHSLGAMATLAVAANTCCYDRRVKAAMILAGREMPFGSGTFFARIRTPLLLIHGDADTNVAYRDGRKAYADAPPPRFFLTLPGGDHSAMFDPFDGPAATSATQVAIAFFDDYLKGAAAGLDRLRAGPPVGVAGLESEI